MSEHTKNPNHSTHNQDNNQDNTNQDNNRALQLVYGVLFAVMVIGFLMFYITACTTSI